MKHALSAFYHLPRRALMMLVKAYRLLLSPWLGSSCRFEPTCSAYSLQALAQHGAVAGTALTAYRLVRCQPWCEGGHDPVPQVSLFFTRLITPAVSTTLSSEKKPS
jgi:putative membrane protein insertion efficiency factor